MWRNNRFLFWKLSCLLGLVLTVPSIGIAGNSSSQGVSSQSVNSQRVSPQTISRPSVSRPSVSRPSGSGRGSVGPQRTKLTTVHGKAQGNPVLPPATHNTFRLKAQYYTPNPASESKPFDVVEEEVRLPVASKGNVYWVPNAQSIVVKPKP